MSKALNYIKEALKSGRLSHSYLISGSEEISLGKSIAKHVLCKQEHTGCGSCSSCLKLASDNHPDMMFIEPDGASIKNAQVEAFQEFIYIRPFESANKIVVFQKAHLMTDRAQNRILKVLEEPPEYAVFIFLTSQMDLMLDTVLSRCQVISEDETTEPVLDNVMMEKVLELAKGIETADVGRVFEYGPYLKKEKEKISEFLMMLSILLRDALIYRETNNIHLITRQNLTILNYKDNVFSLSKGLSRIKNIALIECIEETDLKLKNNMNFDLTIDKLLVKCIEREA